MQRENASPEHQLSWRLVCSNGKIDAISADVLFT